MPNTVELVQTELDDALEKDQLEPPTLPEVTLRIREIDDLSLSSATCRVAGYLLTQAGSGGGTFDLKVPKQTLASRLSVQPETFSRIVRQLRNQGILTVQGSRVEISDYDRLKLIADVCAQPEDSLEETFHYLGAPFKP